MAITDKEQGVWGLEQVYNKQNEGDIWEYSVNQGLFMWGWAGDYGVLGQNGAYASPARISSPAQVPGTTWNVLSLYNNFAHALKNDGSHWVWGSASTGDLGQNVPDNTHLSSPTQLPGTWSAITSSNYSMMGIKTDGTMWSWGDNGNGHLGVNDRTNRSSPTQVGTSTNWGTGGNNLSGSEYSVQAIKENGTLWVWGYNRDGNLGQNNDNPARFSSPTQVGTNTTWNKCRGFFNSMVATKTDGTLWCWGNNQQGQIGQNDTSGPFSSPKQVGSGTDWTGQVWKGYKSAYAIKTNGTLWAWGNNEGGSLGQNQNDVYYSSPVQIGTETTWRSGGALGYRGVAATKTDGTLWTWGSNGGSLALNNETQYSSPVQVGSDTDWDYTNYEQIYGATNGGLKKAL